MEWIDALPPVTGDFGQDHGRLRIRDWSRCAYDAVFDAMLAVTEARRSDRTWIDELWVVEHEPVYTLGQATDPAHLPLPGTPGAAIPIRAIDRGGQITYHGPGQLVLYFLLDLSRRKMKVRDLVSLMENETIRFLADAGISAHARPDAPGVYVNDAKIASLGLKIRHGCSYHGLSLNIDMDLSPFDWIHPCGYPGLRVTQLRDFVDHGDFNTIKATIISVFAESLAGQVCAGWRKK